MQYQLSNRIRTKARTLRARTLKACTLYASLLADEKRERNCVALEAVSSRPEIQCRGEGAPVVIPTRFPEDVRADFRAQNRLDFRRIVGIGVVMGWPSQSRPLKGSPRDSRGLGSCERQVRRREPTEPEYVNPFHRERPETLRPQHPRRGALNRVRQLGARSRPPPPRCRRKVTNQRASESPSRSAC
jgi:hypothetical protein